MWLLQFFGFCAAMLAAVAGFDAACDPLQLFRPSDVFITDQQHQRLAYAGLIRSHPEYEAAIVGSSLSANFDPALFQSLFGERVEVLSMLNGRPREIEDVVRYVLKHQPKVRHLVVEWDVSDGCETAYPGNVVFPRAVYRDRLSGDLAYLLSYDTVAKSVAKLRAGPEFAPSLAPLTRTYESTRDRYGKRAILEAEAGRFHLQAREMLDPATVTAQADAWAACFRSILLPVIASHPGVRFDLVRWPTFQWALRLVDLRPVFAAYDRSLEAARGLSNVAFHDFDADAALVGDCSHYMDLFHFDQAASDALLRALAEGRFRRTAATAAGLDAQAMATQAGRAACS